MQGFVRIRFNVNVIIDSIVSYNRVWFCELPLETIDAKFTF